MRAILKPGFLIVAPDDVEDVTAIQAWRKAHRRHYLRLREHSGRGMALRSLGDPTLDIPINVTARHADRRIQLISNFAATPFDLDGQRYESGEGFWQSLKFRDPARRSAVANLAGVEANRAGAHPDEVEIVRYAGQSIMTGSFEHWKLMERACRAKFEQNQTARKTLLSTLPRELIHKPRRDSQTIPGAVMARIWMSIRHSLAGTIACTSREATGHQPLHDSDG